MPTATYTGEGDFSGEITIGPASAMIFPAGRTVPITDEVAQILVKDHAKNFAVVDSDGQPVKPEPEAGPEAANTEDSGAGQGKKGKPGK